MDVGSQFLKLKLGLHCVKFDRKPKTEGTGTHIISEKTGCTTHNVASSVLAGMDAAAFPNSKA